MIGRTETWSPDHSDTAAFRAKQTEPEVKQIFEHISSADLKILKEMSVFTSSKHFEDCLKRLLDAISGAEATLQCGFRAVVLLSLSAIIVAPGNFEDPRASLLSSMNMFKQNSHFQSCNIPRKLHEMVLAQMAAPKIEAAGESKDEKENQGKKDKKQNKVKHDKKSKKKSRDVEDDDDDNASKEDGAENDKPDPLQEARKEKKSKKDKKHKKQ